MVEPVQNETPQHAERFRAVHESMLEGLGELAAYFGFSKVLGQLYAALMLSPGPLSLDDLKDLLEISKPSVSTNMRTLEALGAVREVYVRGDRRKYYEAGADLWRVVQRILSSRELRDVERALHVLGENADQLRAGMPAMQESSRELAELYLERIDALQEFFRLAQFLLQVILSSDDAPDLGSMSPYAHLKPE
ncbi:MAG: HTH domain-containing protein [Anaerolineae bacterium]|nr:HTH domain-containing protein [Anaerolineae bacterium]